MGNFLDAIEVCTNLEDLSDRDPKRPTRQDSPHREGPTRYPGCCLLNPPPTVRPELRLVSTDLGQHLSQSSAAAQHAQHVVACTHTRTRQWRHRTISRRHVVRCDRSSSRQVRDSWKARRRRTFSTRVSSVIGVKTLTRTFLKITRRSLCVHCL